eukprot:TRINITY_DN3305_c0_g2_i1.p1 TRINITY_DN3305_c0_g2~~TRINITY_DN3305_c0_g2_i1.p1  ORF type:complete len:485 (+),score=118.26 TRINITY_DN3305_c0_g2_i1:153-1607(+)
MSKAKLKTSLENMEHVHLDPIHNDPSATPMLPLHSSYDSSTKRIHSNHSTNSIQVLSSNINPTNNTHINVNTSMNCGDLHTSVPSNQFFGILPPKYVNNNYNEPQRHSVDSPVRVPFTIKPSEPSKKEELPNNIKQLFLGDEDSDESLHSDAVTIDLLGGEEDQDGTRTKSKESSTGLSTMKKGMAMPLWMGLALVSHFLWGIYPVLARYLQTQCGIPSLSLLFAANIPCSIITLAIILYRNRLFEIIKSKMLPTVVLVSAIRASTNLLAPKFTSAIYVQLITLATPFIVAGMNMTMSLGELPKGTYPAMFATSVGAILMVISSASPLKFDLVVDDGVGLTLALASALFLALYMIFVKKCTTGPNAIPNEELLFFLTFPLVAIGGTFSFILEEKWEPWGHLTLGGWMALIGLTFGCNLCGNFLQVAAIKNIGAPMVSSCLAFRLISSLVFSQLIMREVLKSYFQMVGAFIVLTAITLYLWNQKK